MRPLASEGRNSRARRPSRPALEAESVSIRHHAAGAVGLERDECRVVEVDSAGPGNALMVWIESEHSTEFRSVRSGSEGSAPSRSPRAWSPRSAPTSTPAPRLAPTSPTSCSCPSRWSAAAASSPTASPSTRSPIWRSSGASCRCASRSRTKAAGAAGSRRSRRAELQAAPPLFAGGGERRRG